MNILLWINTIRTTLMENFNAVDKWFDKDSSLRSYPPSGKGWSIDQVLEHITLTNYFLLILISKASQKAKRNIHGLDLETELKNYVFHKDTLDEVGIHKSFDWIRPEHMEPKGEKTSDEVRVLLKIQLKECLHFLEMLPNGEGVLFKTTMTVNNLGKIDVYEYLYFLAKHAERHIAQMTKVEDEYKTGKY